MNQVSKQIDNTRSNIMKVLQESGIHPAVLLLILKDVYTEVTAHNNSIQDKEDSENGESAADHS